MFDGEDALGQVDTMSFDNQRNLAIAFGRQEPFLRIAENVAAEMNAWAKGFLGRRFLPLMLLTGVGVFLISRLWAGLFIVFIVFEGVALAAALAATQPTSQAASLTARRAAGSA